MRILGVSAYYHDSAAALIEDGRVIAAAQEERFTRRKHDAAFPKNAVQYCLSEAQVPLSSLDAVVFYEKPFLKFERLLETYMTTAPRGFRQFLMAMPVWLREKLFQKSLLAKELKEIDPDFDPEKLLFSEHHLSHAASAYFPSPFESAAILTLDGVGEWTTTAAALGQGSRIELTKELQFPHSLGLLYSAFTYYTGFKVNSGEYKLMGLAPYGEPKFADKILDNLIDVKPDGSFRLNMSFFDYMTGFTMTNRRFARLFGEKVRGPEDRLTAFHMDIAASVQAVTEEVVLRLTRSLAAETGQPNLCLAGGVALNCVANGKVLRDGSFERIWVQRLPPIMWNSQRPVRTPTPSMRCRAPIWAPPLKLTASPSASPPQAHTLKSVTTTSSTSGQRTHLLAKRRSAGSKGGWSLVRARLATARSWATRAVRRCSGR